MAVQLGSAYGQVVLDANGVRKGAAEAEGAFAGLEKKGSMAMAALGLSIAGMGVLLKRTVDRSLGLSTEFETSSVRMGLAADNTAGSFETLHDAAIRVGDDSRLLGVSASGAAASMEGLYKSGLSNTVIFGNLNGYMAGTVELGGALRASIDLAAASELDMVQASDLAAVSLSTFGAELESDTEKAEFINEALDNFVRAADASVAEVSDLAAAMVNIGPDAARMGFTIQDVNNALAILSTRGIAGAEAGTALKSMLLNMNRQTPAVVGALRELNVSLYDAEGRMRSLPEIIGDLERAFAGLTDEQRDHYMQTLAGNYGIKAMSTLVAEGTDGWYAMADATANATGIQERAARMSETLAGRTEALEGNVETLYIMIGEKLMPVAKDWVEWMIAVIDDHGPKVVDAVGKIADGVLWVSDALQGEGTPLQNTAAQMAGLATAAGVGFMAFQKLAPVVTTVGTVLGDGLVGLQLWAGGAKVAEVASLGFGAALGPIVLGVAAVGTALYAANKAHQLHQDIQEKTAEVGDQWVGFLERQAEEQENATGVAAVYVEKQQEVGQVLEDNAQSSNLLKRAAAGLIDRQSVMNADTQALGEVLLETATDYQDYQMAVDAVNTAMVDQAETMGELSWAYDNMIQPVSMTTFELLRGNVTLESGFIAAQMMTMAVSELGDAEARAERDARALAAANQDSAEAYLGAVNALQSLGVITRQEAAEMRGVVIDEFGQITTATDDVAEAQRRLAEVAAGAWDSFAQSVYTGVQSALTAYREGNEELYAEQQAALGQMVLNQAEVMVATGEMTHTQFMDLRVGIQEQFGIAVDEAQLGRDRLLGLFADFAQGGKTEVDDIIAFIQDIGPETEAMATTVEEDMQRANEAWVTFKGEVQTATLESSRDMVTLGQDIGTIMSTMESEIESAAQEFATIGTAVAELPTEHTFTFRFRTEGQIPSVPEAAGWNVPAVPGPLGAYAGGTDYAAGGWAMVGERGPEMAWLPQGTQVLSARETAALMADAATVAQVLQTAGMAGGAALSSRDVHYYDNRKVEVAAELHDALDYELLARRVAEIFLRRGH